MRVLVTGFEPFGGSTVNPSQEIVRAISSRPASHPFGIQLHTRVLPVEAMRGPAALAAAIDEH